MLSRTPPAPASAGRFGSDPAAPDSGLADRLRSLSNDRLHLVLLPTEACNFRCVYCYEEFRHKRMEPAVVRGVKNLLSRRAEALSSLFLSWFGGEPLLAQDIMEEILVHVRGLVDQRPRLAVTSDVTTNGYLLDPARFRRLVNLGVTEFQISLDGPREYHDRYRVMSGGKGTFDRIWENLLAMRRASESFQTTVRLHVNRENAPALPAFLDEYERAFAGEPRFRLFVRTLSRLGGPNDASLPVFDEPDGRRVVEAIRDEVDRRGLAQNRFKPEGAICYAAQANSLVVRSNGRLSKCTVALEHPNNEVGRIHEDGTVALDREKMMQWMRGVASGDLEAMKCPMKGYATAPAMAFAGGSRIPLPMVTS